MTESQSQQKTEPRRRVWRRRVILVLFLGMLGWFGHYVWLRVTLTSEPRDEYWFAKIRALDPLAEDALSYDQVVSNLSNPPWSDSIGIRKMGMPREFDSVLSGPWSLSRKDVSGVCRLFASDEFTVARDRVVRSAQKDWGLNSDALDPVDRMMYRWCNVLLAHSRYSLERNDTDQAVEDWLTVLRMGRQFRRKQGFIGFQWEAALQIVVGWEIIYASSKSETLVDAVSLGKEIRQIIGEPPTVEELVSGDFYYARMAIDRCFVRRGKGWLDLPSSIREHNPRAGFAPPAWKDRLWNILSFVFHDYDQAVAAVEKKHEYFLTLHSVSGMLVHIDSLRQMGLNEKDGYFRYGGLYTEWVSNSSLARIVGARITLDAAVAMHGIQRYSIDHGKVPESLDELIPGYCPQPVDLVDGRQLRYRKYDNGFVLYSIWFDFEDNGGVSNEPYYSVPALSVDLVFTGRDRSESYYDEVIEDPS